MNAHKNSPAGAAAGFCFAAAALTGIVWVLACFAPLMERMMTRYAPPEISLLPAAEYPGMARMITDFLAGRIHEFQYIFTSGGSEWIGFHDYEAAHMTDCQHLIGLDGIVTLALAGLLVLWVLLGLRNGERTHFRKGFLTGTAIFTALVAAGAIWALIDFDGLFTTFHHLAFTNDLWLLDPRTDLLIRLMPEEFFVAYGVLGAGIWLLILTAVTVPMIVCQSKAGSPKERKEP